MIVFVAGVGQHCRKRAEYFDRTKGHFDREDAARSYRATAKELEGLAICALASPRQEPAPAADAENAWIEHIQSNNYDYEYEKIRSAFIAGFAAARASGEKGGAR